MKNHWKTLAPALLLATCCSPALAQGRTDAMVAGFNKDIDNALVLGQGQFIADPVLNAFFNRQVSRYLSTSGDLTLSKGFALLDNANDRLTLGGQYTNSDISSVIRLVFSGGLGADIKKGVSTVFKNGKAQNNLGVFLKGTFVFNGCMSLGAKDSTWTKEREQRITDITLQHKRAAQKAAKDWVENLRAEEGAATIKRTTEEMDEEKLAQFEKLLGDLSRAAATQIEKKKAYRNTHSAWISAEGYLPLSPTNYYTVDSVTAGLWDTHELRACEGKLNVTYLFTNRCAGTVFLTAWGGYLNNNNILSTQLTTTAASQNSTTLQGDTLALVQLDGQETVGIGEYARFDTYKVGGRLVWMPCPWIGLSGEVERWIGDYEPRNWKIGMPLSFKNEKGERTINFEVQWREQLDVHSLGISVGLPFGGSLYR